MDSSAALLSVDAWMSDTSVSEVREPMAIVMATASETPKFSGNARWRGILILARLQRCGRARRGPTRDNAGPSASADDAPVAFARRRGRRDDTLGSTLDSDATPKGAGEG